MTQNGFVTMRDCLKAGFCVPGIRAWLAERDYDYRTFVREGLPIETVEGFGDALADRAIAKARERAS